MILAGLVAARFLHYAGLLLLFGGATFRLFASREDAHEPLARSLSSLLFWSSLATLAGALLVLAFTAANLTGALGGMADPSTLQAILLDTDFGRVWGVRLALAAGLASWFLVRSDRTGSRQADWIVLLLAGALASTVALTGHAQIRTDAAGLTHRAADALHLVAGAVWLGALLPLLHLLRASPSQNDALRAGRLLQRFHLVGLVAVSVLLLSGLVNSWFLVGDVGRLLGTPYGRLLLLKLALFAAMVGFAADNRLRLVPRLNAALAQGLPPQAWLAPLRRHIGAEFLLGLAVLLAVAVLGAIAPAIDAEPL